MFTVIPPGWNFSGTSRPRRGKTVRKRLRKAARRRFTASLPTGAGPWCTFIIQARLSKERPKMEPPSSDSVLVGRIRLDTTIRGAFERPEVALAFEGRECGPVWPCPWGWWRLWEWQKRVSTWFDRTGFGYA